jgi:GMC oxidoreductase
MRLPTPTADAVELREIESFLPERTREPTGPTTVVQAQIFAYIVSFELHTLGGLMGIHGILAKNLDEKAPTFIDALGHYICSSWDDVDKANGNRPFDVVIIGAGMFGAYCAEKLFRRDSSDDLRILVLDAGPFFLPTHKENLPVSNIPQSVWVSTPPPWRGNPAYMDNNGGLAYCIGGRSLFWAGWAPELTSKDLEKWPAAVRDFLDSDNGYLRTGREIGSKKKTDFIEDTILHQNLKKAFATAVGKDYDAAHIDCIDDAPLAVLGSPPTPGIFPFEKYSSVTFLIDAINADRIKSEDAKNPRARHLMLLPRAEVIGLKRKNGKEVTSLDLEVSGVPETLQLGPKTKVILANGTVEATRLALAHLGVGRKVDEGPSPRVRNFMAHMGNSISVRIKRRKLGLDGPDQPGNQLAAFIARGTALRGTERERRFHYQIVAAALNPGEQTPWERIMKIIPDIDQLDKFMSGHDPDWITLVFRGIAEMEDERDPNVAPKDWKNWIGLEGNFAYANLIPSKNDEDVRAAMDKAAIGLAQHLAPNPNDIEYDWGGDPKTKWRTDELESFTHDSVGASHHEGGTLFMGAKGKSITDEYGKFHDVPNVYVVGPAVFPTIGDANPSLTGLTLARRTGDKILEELRIPRRNIPMA